MAEATLRITARNDAGPAVRQLADDVIRMAASLDGSAADAIKQQRAFDRMAGATIAAARAQRDFSTAIRVAETALSTADQGTERYARNLARLINLKAAAARAGSGLALPSLSLDQIGPSVIRQLAGMTAGVAGLQAVTDRFAQGFNLIVSLEQSRKALGRFLGDVQRGDQVFAQAAAAGRAYGVTQQETANILQSLGPLVRTSTTSIEEQIGVLLRLSNLNPGAGVDNAARALRQLASGDYAPFADSLNVSKEAAKGLRDELAKGGDVFEVTSRFLDRMGLTASSLTDRLTGAEGAQRRLAQANEDVTRAFGQLATSKVIVDDLTLSAQQLSEIMSKLAILFNAGQKVQGFADAALAGATSFDAYRAKIDEINAALPFYVSQITPLTEAQFALGRALLASGNTAGQVNEKLQRTADVASGLQQAIRTTNPELQTVAPLMIEAASSSDTAAAGVLKLSAAYTDGALTLPQFQSQLEQMAAAQKVSAEATAKTAWIQGEYASANQDATSTITAATEAQLLEEAQTRLTTDAKDQLRNSAIAAAQAILASGDASDANRQKYAELYGVSLKLVDAYYQIEQAASAAAAAQRLEKERADAMAAQRAGERNPNVNPRAALSYEKQRFEERAAAQAKARAEAEAAARRLASEQARGARKAANATESAARKAATEQQRAAEQQQRDAEQYAARLKRAQEALMQDEDLLARRRQELAAAPDEATRLELTKEIADLEARISQERQRQADAAKAAQRDALDAALARLDAEEKTAQETRDLAKAQNVLKSRGTSTEQKDAARREIERIGLERQKRALEGLPAGQTTTEPSKIGLPVQDITRANPLPVLFVGSSAAPTIPTVPTAPGLTLPPAAVQAAQQAITNNITIEISNYVSEGRTTATVTQGTANIRVIQRAAQSAMGL